MTKQRSKPARAQLKSLFSSLASAFFAILTCGQPEASAQQLRWLGLDEQGMAARQEFLNSSVGRRGSRVESLIRASLKGIRARRDYGRVVSMTAISQFFEYEVEAEFGPIEDAHGMQSVELEHLIKMTLSSQHLGEDSAFDLLAVTAIRYFQEHVDTIAQREVGNPANKLRRLAHWIREQAPKHQSNEAHYQALARLYEYLAKESLESRLLAEQEMTANLCAQLLLGGH